MQFLGRKHSHFEWNFTKVCYWGFNWHQVIISSGNGMVSMRHQAIAWPDDDKAHWHMHMPQGQYIISQLPVSWFIFICRYLCSFPLPSPLHPIILSSKWGPGTSGSCIWAPSIFNEGQFSSYTQQTWPPAYPQAALVWPWKLDVIYTQSH